MPAAMRVCDGRLYFSATSLGHGRELRSVGGAPAAVETLGVGCGPNPPVLAATTPVLGQPMSVFGHRAPGGPGALVFGFPTVGGYLSGVVAPGCAIWADLGLSIVLPLPSAVSHEVTVLVPRDPSLQGAQVAIQGAYAPLPMRVSNGVKVTVGN